MSDVTEECSKTDKANKVGELGKISPTRSALAWGPQIGRKATRKQLAQQHMTRTVWMGLGWMGLIGWAVAIPTLLGAALGMWVDQHYPGRHNWTLALLVAGLVLGCFHAWHWVSREEREIHGQALQPEGDGEDPPEADLTHAGEKAPLGPTERDRR